METSKKEVAESASIMTSADVIITLKQDKLVWWKRILIRLGWMKNPYSKFKIIKNRFSGPVSSIVKVDYSKGVMDMDCDEIDKEFLSPKTRHAMKNQTYDPLLCPVPKPIDPKRDM